jgi:hypothetical protein
LPTCPPALPLRFWTCVPTSVPAVVAVLVTVPLRLVTGSLERLQVPQPLPTAPVLELPAAPAALPAAGGAPVEPGDPPPTGPPTMVRAPVDARLFTGLTLARAKCTLTPCGWVPATTVLSLRTTGKAAGVGAAATFELAEPPPICGNPLNAMIALPNRNSAAAPASSEPEVPKPARYARVARIEI